MRVNGFLRAPIRVEHQSLLRNVQVSDVPFAQDPTDPAAPYPQALEISFEPSAGVTEVQISLPWEGMLSFIPDSTAGYPRNVEAVSRENSKQWPLKGMLVLKSLQSFKDSPGLSEAFSSHLPVVSPSPTMVHFSKVKLTEDFLFDTLGQLPRHHLVFDGKKVPRDDLQWLQKLVIKFLEGTVSVPFLVDPNDPSLDSTLLAMPSIHLAPIGSRSTFYVTAANGCEKELLELDSSWFAHNSKLDDFSGERLVPDTIAIDIDGLSDEERTVRYRHQLKNPLHPNFSVIPMRMIYQIAPDAAYASDNLPTSPIRAGREGDVAPVTAPAAPTSDR